MEQNNSRFIFYIFFIISILELCTHVFDWVELRHFTKPLLIPALMLFFKRHLAARLNASFMLAFTALIFCWIGDVSLMYEENDSIYFLIGLSAFAAAQVLYIISFAKARYTNETILLPAKRIVYPAPFILLAMVLLLWLIPAAGALAYPLMVYTLLLLGMLVSAIFRMDQTNRRSFHQLFFGAMLFLLSDSLSAFNKFLMPIKGMGFPIMLSYILAQWSIVNGLLKHYNERRNTHLKTRKI